ncbi:MAG: 23S rRNA (adenine(2503)-C(2))-methyltransferase RlmN [Actinobacteria bacterium]|nr:23S rRNA (adenine(2503)-C(2))-methyltransferase RlmN [Actinomycetota bacterium]
MNDVIGPVDPYTLGRPEAVALLERLGEPAFRGRQLHDWVGRGVDDPSLMTDLPLDLRWRLEEMFAPTRPELVRHVVADDGATHKFLLRLPDGESVETVLMLYPRRRNAAARATVCVSTQAGCAMGCPFCATGQAGFRRQLTSGEVVRQVAIAAAVLRSGTVAPGAVPDHVTNVVFMGMGEPLANLSATERAVRWLHDPEGLRLSARSITVSTVGIVPGIRRLAQLGLPLTLAVSLHAPDDALRDELVPINRVHPLASLLAATREYRELTRRRVTFEYVLIADVNDSVQQAIQLADLVREHRAHVNLIPLNPTPGVPQWREPEPSRVRAFAAALERGGVATTVRDTRGRSADAACGQLLATYHLDAGRRLPVALGAAARVDALRIAPQERAS